MKKVQHEVRKPSEAYEDIAAIRKKFPEGSMAIVLEPCQRLIGGKTIRTYLATYYRKAP